MKLVRYGARGLEKPGLIDRTGRIRDLSGFIGDITGEILSRESLDRLRGLREADLPIVDGTPRIGPPIGRVPKIIGAGMNYRAFALSAGAEIPEEPVLFFKATSAITGPTDPLIIPRGSSKTDWEVELAVVIGETARHVSSADSLAYVAGYCVANDVSARDWIPSLAHVLKGKCADSFAPLGPWLVTADEVSDPQTLDLSLYVNGVRRQSGHTSDMIFSVSFLISYISDFMTLQPGDVILTGTPEGVGMRHSPPIYLAAGDVVHASISGLGDQVQPVVSYL